MKIHYLKIEQKYLDEVTAKRKTFEVRKNDRDFKINDVVYLCGLDPESKKLNGKIVKVIITYILDDFKPLNEFCVFSFVILQRRSNKRKKRISNALDAGFRLVVNIN